MISPNILKNKLLERIKSHKLKETEGLVNNKTKLDEPNNSKKSIYEPEVFSDEFSDSNSYFQALSNQKKMDKKKESSLIRNRFPYGETVIDGTDDKLSSILKKDDIIKSFLQEPVRKVG